MPKRMIQSAKTGKLYIGNSIGGKDLRGGHNKQTPSKGKKPPRTEPTPLEYLTLGRLMRQHEGKGEICDIWTYAHSTQGACFLLVFHYQFGTGRTRVFATGETEYIGAGTVDGVNWQLAVKLTAKVREEFCKPSVIISVTGGVVDWWQTGDIRVTVIDFDNLKEGDPVFVEPWMRATIDKSAMEQIDKLNADHPDDETGLKPEKYTKPARRG